MPGPKRTAPVIKLFRGTYRRDRDGPLPPSADQAPVDLVAPDWFSPSQAACWRHVVANMPGGTLRLIDAGILTVYVVAADLHQQAAQEVQEHGAVVKLGAQPAMSPYQRICDRQAAIVLQAAAALGIGRGAASPSSNNFSHNGRRPPDSAA